MDIGAAQRACEAAGLPIDVADRVLATALKYEASGLYRPEQRLAKSAEGHKRRMLADQPYIHGTVLPAKMEQRGQAKLMHGLDFGDYCRYGGYNFSTIKHIAKSPRHMRHAAANPPPDKTAWAKLRTVHTLVLDPHRFATEYVVFRGAESLRDDPRVMVWTQTATRGKAFEAAAADNPDRVLVTERELETGSTSRAGNLFAAFASLHAGRTILMEHEYRDAEDSAHAIRSHPVVAELLSQGDPEVTIQWVDERTGLPCKGRVDWLGPGYVVDLKGYGTTDERLVGRHVAQNYAHAQLAHYSEGLRACGRPMKHHYIIAYEPTGARDVGVFRLLNGAPDGPLYIGREVLHGWMDRVAAAVAEDSWPGRHPSGVVDLSLPMWALLNDEDELEIEG